MKTETRLVTQERILKTAGTLFSQRGYFGVSMSQIAKEIGMTKAALYYHFDSKEELYRTILKNTFSSLSVVLEEALSSAKTPFAKLFNVIEAYLAFTLEKPEVSLLAPSEFEAGGPLAEFSNQARSQLTHFLKRLISTLGKGSQISEEKILLLGSFLLGVVRWPLLVAPKTSKKLTKDIISLFFPQITLNAPKDAASE